MLLEEFGTVGYRILQETGDEPDLMALLEILDCRSYRRSRAIWEGEDAEAKKRLSRETCDLMTAVDERRILQGW